MYFWWNFNYYTMYFFYMQDILSLYEGIIYNAHYLAATLAGSVFLLEAGYSLCFSSRSFSLFVTTRLILHLVLWIVWWMAGDESVARDKTPILNTPVYIIQVASYSSSTWIVSHKKVIWNVYNTAYIISIDLKVKGNLLYLQKYLF